jgi:hypothetical protein
MLNTLKCKYEDYKFDRRMKQIVEESERLKRLNEKRSRQSKPEPQPEPRLPSVPTIYFQPPKLEPKPEPELPVFRVPSIYFRPLKPEPRSEPDFENKYAENNEFEHVVISDLLDELRTKEQLIRELGIKFNKLQEKYWIELSDLQNTIERLATNCDCKQRQLHPPPDYSES